MAGVAALGGSCAMVVMRCLPPFVVRLVFDQRSSIGPLGGGSRCSATTQVAKKATTATTIADGTGTELSRPAPVVMMSGPKECVEQHRHPDHGDHEEVHISATRNCDELRLSGATRGGSFESVAMSLCDMAGGNKAKHEEGAEENAETGGKSRKR